MANSLVVQLREGYLDAAASLSEESLALVARARDPINTDPLERNRLLAQIVCAYRVGRRQIWGPVILDLLAPTLVMMLQGLRPEPPVIDHEEITQQLVVEALRAAACIPLHESGRQTRYRILSRTYTSMLRWLAREGRRRRTQVAYEPLMEPER